MNYNDKVLKTANKIGKKIKSNDIQSYVKVTNIYFSQKMPLTSPGGWGDINPVMKLTTVIILTLGTFGTLSRGEATVSSSSPHSDGLRHSDFGQTVVLEIGNVNQPDNCSEFLNDLEVRSIWFLKSDLQSGLTLKIQF